MPYQETPRNVSELQARIAQRDELAAQLRAITTQRGQLGQERLNAMAREEAGAKSEARLVAELDQRIRELGERERRLERQKISADDAIADALARGVGQNAPALADMAEKVTSVQVQPSENLGPMRDMYRSLMIGEALAFILLGVVAWRYVVRSVERRLVRTAAMVPPHMEKLHAAVDSIAVEVERISENQRYITKLLSGKGVGALGEGAAQPLAADRERESVKDRR